MIPKKMIRKSWFFQVTNPERTSENDRVRVIRYARMTITAIIWKRTMNVEI